MTGAAPRRRIARALALAAVVGLVGAAAYHALGAAVFSPRLASDDPRVVVTAYFDAQRWGYRALAERALAPDEREIRRAPNYVRPLVPDELWASDLVVSEPADIALHGEYTEEVQFTVTYRSAWRSTIGEPPGQRHWFVYAGRDGGGRWLILGQGTGP